MAIVHTVTGNPAEVLKVAKERIIKEGGDIQGDSESGDFSVKGFKGTYSSQSDSVELRITQKPFLVPESLVVAWLKENIRI